MDETEFLRISTDENAWDLVNRWVRDEAIPPVEFDNWPRLRITVCGEQFKSSLRSSQMEALVDFKMSMGRSFAAIAHGAYDKRRLKQEEEELLEFSTSVREGSSILDTDLSPLVEALAGVANARPTETLVAGVVIGLALIARPLILRHFDNRARQLEADERKHLQDLLGRITQDDRQRWALFDKAMTRLTKIFPSFPQMVPDAAKTYWRLASASVDADNMQVSGVRLTHDNLQVLSERRSARKAEISEFTGPFFVDGVVKVRNKYRAQLRGETFSISATFSDTTLDQRHLSRLTQCMGKSYQIEATIEIKKVEGSSVSGRLKRFKAIPPESNEDQDRP